MRIGARIKPRTLHTRFTNEMKYKEYKLKKHTSTKFLQESKRKYEYNITFPRNKEFLFTEQKFEPFIKCIKVEETNRRETFYREVEDNRNNDYVSTGETA